MKLFWAKINDIIDESAEVKTYLLERPEDFTWEEGAHTHFALKGFNAGDKPNRSLIRHMSISTMPNENTIGITTRIKEQSSEFKAALRELKVGDEVAIFKTHSNIPLRRENKNVYLLSSGVGLATFRPLVLDYFERPHNVNKIHSLNIESSRDYIFTEIFKSATDQNFTSKFVDNREEYYEEVKKLAEDKEGHFYIVGSDEFLVHNIELLLKNGIQAEQIKLDKHDSQLPDFLTL